MMGKWYEIVDLASEFLWVPGIQMATGQYFHYQPESRKFWRWNISTLAWDNVTATIGTILAAGPITPVVPVQR